MEIKTFFSLIIVSLLFVPVVNADCIELRYDDGVGEAESSSTKGHQYGVKFSLPPHYQSAIITSASFFDQQ
jgi:hypothetical protein